MKTYLCPSYIMTLILVDKRFSLTLDRHENEPPQVGEVVTLKAQNEPTACQARITEFHDCGHNLFTVSFERIKPCECVDCGGDQPGHSLDCGYMLALH